MLRLILIISLISLLTGCSKSPKKMISEGDAWCVSMPGTSKDNSLEVRFSEKEITCLQNNIYYSIKWVDENSLSIMINDNNAIVFLEKTENNNLKAAFLMMNEKKPTDTSDWNQLQEEERVLSLTKVGKVEKEIKIYKVDNKTIPTEIVPPPGVYEWGRHAVKVIMSGGKATFQYKEDDGSFIDVQTDMDETGTFSFKNYGGSYFQYIGNGIIQNSGPYFHGMTDETSNFVNKVSINNEFDGGVLENAVRISSTYDYIYKDGEKFGKIVKVEIPGSYPHSGGNLVRLNIPNGKMWTPLYYEQVKGNKDMSVMEVFHKTNRGFGYWDYSRFEISKEQFVSAKFSKQNNESYVGKGLVGVSVTSWEPRNTLFYLYLLEESI